MMELLNINLYNPNYEIPESNLSITHAFDAGSNRYLPDLTEPE